MLLVIDNFEQIIGAFHYVLELISACSHLKILLTSREALRVGPELIYPVPPLKLPLLGVKVDCESLLLDDATLLFIIRAEQANPALVVSNDDASLVVEICRRLDGLPLAIELAASRMRVLETPAAD